MSMNSRAVSVVLAVVGLVVTADASARSIFLEPAPESSIQLCVEQIGEQANYTGSNRVLHDVNTKARRVDGHKVYVKTQVFAADTSEVLRKYKTVCSMSDESVMKRIAVKETQI